jgi:hypothetical protein
MTEDYSHFDARQLAAVMEAQHVIVGNKKREKKAAIGKASKATKSKAGAGEKAGRPELKIVKMPDRVNRAAKKGA